MRVGYFINRQGMEKNPNQPMEIKENCEMRMIDLQNTAKDGARLSNKSNTVWCRFKRWLLVFIHRKRL